MNHRILEIGTANSPATVHAGPFLQDTTTEYVGIDTREERLRGAVSLGYQGPFMAAEAAELPFPDQVFTHVIMMSVFGEYTMGPDMTGSSLDNTFNGLFEAFRVLKNGGQLLIAEENTPEAPATPRHIGSVLLEAGFEDIIVMPCQDMTNSNWCKERTKFWDIGKAKDAVYRWRPGEPIDSKFGYLISAYRHNTPTEKFEVTVHTHGNRKSRRTRNTSLQKTARNIPRFSKTYDPASEITVVAKDETFPLSEYKARLQHGTEPFFLR